MQVESVRESAVAQTKLHAEAEKKEVAHLLCKPIVTLLSLNLTKLLKTGCNIVVAQHCT